nr:MAG TPA: cortexin-like protein [Bacteriophage sp.]
MFLYKFQPLFSIIILNFFSKCFRIYLDIYSSNNLTR